MKLKTQTKPITGYERLTFICLLGVFVLSFYFKPVTYYTIDMRAFSFMPNMSISKTIGIHGPTCGLTRSFVNISHGRLIDGFLANFMGPFVYLIFISVFLYLGYRFVGGKKQICWPLNFEQTRNFVFFVIALFMISWIAKLLSGLKFQ